MSSEVGEKSVGINIDVVENQIDKYVEDLSSKKGITKEEAMNLICDEFEERYIEGWN